MQSFSTHVKDNECPLLPSSSSSEQKLECIINAAEAEAQHPTAHLEKDGGGMVSWQS